MHIEDHKNQFNINLKNEREMLEESPLVLVRLSTTKTKTKSCKRFLDQIRVTKSIATWQRSVTNLIREALKRRRLSVVIKITTPSVVLLTEVGK
jgi:CRISPR/Cas system CSM-associated protein Csm2 small subunit